MKAIVAQFGGLTTPAKTRLTHHFPAEVVDPAVEVGGDAQLRRHVLRHHRAGRGQARAGTVPGEVGFAEGGLAGREDVVRPRRRLCCVA